MKVFMKISGALFATGLLVGVVFESAAHYYRHDGQKVQLQLIADKMAVSVPVSDGESVEIPAGAASVVGRVADADLSILLCVSSDMMSSDEFAEALEQSSPQAILTPFFVTSDNHEVASTPYLNVRLKSHEDFHLLEDAAELYHLHIEGNSELMPLWYILRITKDTPANSVEIANRLYESGNFSEAVADFTSTDDILWCNDPLADNQWGLRNPDFTGIDVSIEKAWESATGRGVKIAFVDTGVDMNHTDLRQNIHCPGYDTETGNPESRVYGLHGTHCAGIAAAVKDNMFQIAGVAPDAEIMSVSNRLVSSTNSRLRRATGITWAVNNGADIISCSWSSNTRHKALDEAIEYALNQGRGGKGCIVAFASGNDGSDRVCYPADITDGILTVGAIDRNGERASFSQYGDLLDVMAPGVDILSTLPDNGIGYSYGTSTAAPFAAGIAALILEKTPGLSSHQVCDIMAASAIGLKNLTETDHKDYEYGYGLIKAENALRAASDVAAPVPDDDCGFRVYDICGNLIYQGDGSAFTPPSPGIYIIRSRDYSRKIITGTAN